MTKMWLTNVIEKINENKFLYIFYIALAIIVILYVINIFSGTKGTYVDYTETMWDLISKPVHHKRKANKNFESKGETECRRVVEAFTGKLFPKTRPPFLNNIVSGQNLELDCYNEELKIAVEYNGKQHYEFIPHFHINREAFYNVKYRDEMKKRLCEENNVKLIIVPYSIKHEDIETFIKDQL